MAKSLPKTDTLVLIEPEKGWFNLQIRELIRRGFLIRLLIRRDFVAQYKQSILGPLWHIITPLLSTLVFTLVFGKALGIRTDGAPHVLFYLSGVVLWTFFSSSFQKVASTFIENQAIFTKVYFPRLSVPLAAILMRGITLGVQFSLFLVVFAIYLFLGRGVQPNLWLLILPVLILQLGMLAFGCGLIIAAMTVKYRDINYLVVFFTQLWMYATPIVYPMSIVPENWRWVMALNPVAIIVELFRFGFLGSGSPSLYYWGISLCMTAFLVLLGAVGFSRVERTFVDTI